MTKKIWRIISIVLALIVVFITNSYAVSDTNGIYLGLRGK